MPAPNFAVEIRQGAVLVVGDSKNLVAALARRLESLPLAVFTSLSRVGDDYDLDYCVVLGGDLPRLGPHSPTILYVTPEDKQNTLPPLPPSAYLLTYPEVLGTSFAYTPTLDSLVAHAIREGTITLSGDGLAPYHLIPEDALLESIKRCLVSLPTTHRVNLVCASPPSLLSLAYQIRSSLPRRVELLFGSGGLTLPEVVGEGSVEVEGTALDAVPGRVQELAKGSAFPPPPPTPPPTPPPPTRLRTLKEISRERVEFVPTPAPRPPRHLKLTLPRPHLPSSPLLTGLLLGLSLYLASLAFALTATLLSLRHLARSLGALELPPHSLLKLADSTSHYLEINLVALTSLPGISQLQTSKDALLLLTAYRQGVRALGIASSLADSSRLISGYILAGQEFDIGKELETSSLAVTSLYDTLSLLDASLPPIPPALLPPSTHAEYSSLKDTLAKSRRAALTAKSLLSIAPDLLGLGGRRKYLVLLQNNMELRPTGGFIGSLALLSLENGHLYDLPIYDVYQADGQLKGHVEPPTELKKYLGEANWYLRDSNWDPDFPTSARRAEWFLKKTLGEDVQGTIGINVETLSAVLDALGGVTVPDYQETITGDNIFERAEYHSEVNFFAGSTGKKEFLGAVSSALFAKLAQAKGSDPLALVSALVKTIDEKNTLISLSSSKSEDTLHQLGWDGAVRNLPCPALLQGSTCLDDYAFLVESNLGVNKANYFLSRRIDLSVTADADLMLSHKLTLTYTNSAPSSSWPAGPYKNYARLYLPPSTVVESVYVGGKQLGPDQLTLTSEHGKTVAGFLVEVGVASTVEVAVEYRLGSRLTGDKPLYSFYWQKQPGTKADPLTITFNYPLYLRPEIVSPRADLNPQQLTFTLANTTDRRVTVQFAK